MSEDNRSCSKCGASTTYTYEGRPAWHKSAEGWICHTCYNKIYRAGSKPEADAFDGNKTNGGELDTADTKKDLMEIKCANPTCSNRVFVAGSPKMDIDNIEVSCGDCKLVSTYKKKKEKATEVKRIIDGQLRLDHSLEEDSE